MTTRKWHFLSTLSRPKTLLLKSQKHIQHTKTLAHTQVYTGRLFRRLMWLVIGFRPASSIVPLYVPDGGKPVQLQWQKHISSKSFYDPQPFVFPKSSRVDPWHNKQRVRWFRRRIWWGQRRDLRGEECITGVVLGHIVRRSKQFLYDPIPSSTDDRINGNYSVIL